jgi:Flp pilus assembly protein TadD
MCCSYQGDPGSGRARSKQGFDRIYGQCLLLLASLLFAGLADGQDVGSQEKEYLGHGSVITVVVHDPSGQPLSSTAMVRLFRGITPSGQQETSRGVAEFVVTRLGDFTVVVSAARYAEAHKDVTVDITGRTQVDVYLRGSPDAEGTAAVPGRPVLAPKAKEALDKAIRALKENKLGEAEKYVGEAMRLAPGNPDVLYIQGVVHLNQHNWKQAQVALEKAAQLDPTSARTFAALGMALCNEGSYDAAIGPLTKSLQLDPAGAWETQWALAKSYYRLQRYDQALKASQEALQKSNGKAPEIALLVAQSLTAVGRYEDAAQMLRKFLRDHPDRAEAVTAQRWLDQLMASGNLRAN